MLKSTMQINNLHKKALEFAEQAFIKKFANDSDALAMFKIAFGYERDAVSVALKENVSEPTRSVLLQSASSLAINCQEYREAERLIALALSGDPPFEVAEELRNLLEEVNFGRHLKLNNITLSDSEIQLSVTGRAVGFGMVSSYEFWGRVNTFETIALRVAERKLKKPFRESGRINKEIKRRFETFLSVPRAASFAVTIRLGQPSQQLSIPGIEEPIDVINEVVDDLELLNNNKEEDLKSRFEDEAYYRNFIALAKKLAPDGENIKMVGLTVLRDKKEHRVSYTKTRSEIQGSIIKSLKEDQIESTKKAIRIETIGVLSYADAKYRKIKITEPVGKVYTVKVPEGLLADVVKPYWEDTVRVIGTLTGKTITLLDINPVE